MEWGGGVGGGGRGVSEGGGGGGYCRVAGVAKELMTKYEYPWAWLISIPQVLCNNPWLIRHYGS